MKNIFFFRHINQIGGIETFFYYLTKKYEDWDITIYYITGDYKQIKRLRQYVRVKQYTKGEKIVCDKAFFNFNLDIIDNVDAKEYIQIAHGDYKSMGIKPNTNKKITRYLGVSKQVCTTFKEVTGYDTELVYNPIEIDKPKKVLRLISATRLTKEKGKNRMIKLAQMLDKAGIPYLWTIFTNDKNIIDNPNIIYMKPRLDIINYIANSDYLVQLSDNEGYCYSVVEALCVGTPVIVTECPVFNEIGVVNGENGWIVDFNLSNIPIDDIYTKELKFEYTPKDDNWDDILEKGKNTYKEEEKMKVKVKVKAFFTLKKFDELENIERADKNKNEKGSLYAGDTFTCDKEMYDYLNGDNKYKKSYVEIIEELVKVEESPITAEEIFYTEEEVKPKVEFKKTTKKKKTSKK